MPSEPAPSHPQGRLAAAPDPRRSGPATIGPDHPPARPAPDAIDLLRAEHARACELFAAYAEMVARASPPTALHRLARLICTTVGSPGTELEFAL